MRDVLYFQQHVAKHELAVALLKSLPARLVIFSPSIRIYKVTGH